MKSLLIVDDDRDLVEVLEEALIDKGYACRTAHDGRGGLDLIEARPPDLVLLDVEMPILNGPEMAYALLLRDCDSENIPVILSSGIVGLREVAERVGTPYFLEKPYTLDAMMHLVSRALEERTPPHPHPEASP